LSGDHGKNGPARQGTEPAMLTENQCGREGAKGGREFRESDFDQPRWWKARLASKKTKLIEKLICSVQFPRFPDG
jgi:hypothetical protein